MRSVFGAAACALLCGAVAAETLTHRDAEAGEAPALAAGERWVSPAELFSAAERALKPLLEARGAKIEMELPRGVVRGVVVNANAVEVTARPLPADLAWAPRIAVWVDVRDGLRDGRSVLVPVQVRAWQSGWTSVRDLAAGTRLSQTLLRRAEVDVAAGGQAAWQGEPEGQVLRASVMAGHYLGVSQVGVPHAVARGERVELLHKLGAVEILADANSLQDGEIGQHVQVRVEASQGPVLARVVAPGRVELLK